MDCKKEKNLLFVIVLFLAALTFAGFASAACSEGQININNASLEDLDLIKWVGPATAQAIIDTRLFYSLDDLLNVSGIGETKLQDIKNQGLACVDVDDDGSDSDSDEENGSDSDGEDEDKDDNDDCDNDEDSDERDVINYTLKTNYTGNSNKKDNFTFEKIKINNYSNNTKDIKTKPNYALYGLGIFSLLIITLLALRFRRYSKNEFK